MNQSVSEDATVPLSWLHREQQVGTLKLLLSRPQLPDALVYGPPSTGKTAIVR
jgi:Cdc6-like AAA superfamily ATPase